MPDEHSRDATPTRVLLVEDDPHAAMAMRELLRAVWPRGLIVGHTTRVVDAAQELLDHGATCVLLDPSIDQSQLEAIEQLGAASPQTPIIVLAPAGDEEAELAAVRAGAQEVLLRSDLTASVLGRSLRFAVERKRAGMVVARQAVHDPLTSLPNRTLFLDRLRVALDRSRRTGAPVTVMFLDVDGFKEINDSLGHHAGDRLLTVLADRFQKLLRPMDTVARFGGDEFTFLFEGLSGEPEAEEIAERLRHAAGRPVPIGEVQRSVGVSIGVTMISDPASSLDDVIGEADGAMYRAKQLGGRQVQLRATGSPQQSSQRPDLEAGLRDAVSRSQLRVDYQPHVALDDRTGLVGFEALLRWEHPELGLLAPGEFIPVAEQAGLITGIGDWVLHEALQRVRSWRRFRPGVTVSVNVSDCELADPHLADRIGTAVQRSGEAPDALCLEVAAGSLARLEPGAVRQLEALHDLGVGLAIDDFGADRSVISDLSQLPVDTIKIDGSLVSALGRRRSDDATVRSIVELGHAHGLSVVAKSVETDFQLAQLRGLGCDGAQGFLFSRPVAEMGVQELLAARP
ncbi:MAG: putative bifunctional diguanylate cyclase/phosphodiesterase [Solirubrobacteraceae bacterium]